MVGEDGAPLRENERPARLDSLTGLRFFAALVVFGIHSSGWWSYKGAGHLERSAVFHLTSQGAVGVSFFFILSGFVLAWSHKEHDAGALKFWRRRAARILPAYWLAWTIGLCLISTTLVATIFGFLLVQAWVPVADVYFGGNGVSWSLSCEAFFYAVFPLLILIALRYLKQRRQVLAIIAVAGAGIAWPLIWRAPTNAGFRYWISYIFPPARLSEFCLGILIALAVKRGARSPLPLWGAVALAIAAYLSASFVPYYAAWSVITLIPFALLIFSAASGDLDSQRSIFRHRWLIRLGEWSYCFYLFHQLVLREVVHFFKDHHDLTHHHHHIPKTAAISVATVVISLVATIAVSGVVYTLWEKPMEKRLRGVGPVRATSIV